MSEQRKSPEEILAKVKAEERTAFFGKLKIFLGMAAGVGKTYTMLSNAQRLRKDRVDVVAGVVLTHGRKETEVLLDGLESIPERDIEYKGSTLKEFDLDAVLKRHPSVVLVDELAHTNAPGSRHEKRWQDVEELLDNGINVYTTMNIQHLESVNDVVAQITGIRVRETVPDSIFERAYEVEIVDLPPDELIQRLQEGKVYVPQQSKAALENFFRKGNLIALRELALRSTAERVDAQMQRYRTDESISGVWPVNERLLVCVSPSPLSQRLVRAAKRMATRLRSQWIAAWVEPMDYDKVSEKDRDRIVQTLRLAERLGAETTTLRGNNPSEELVSYAERRNVTKIVIGKPARSRWLEIFVGSIVDDLIRKSGDIDVYVITGERHGAAAVDKSTVDAGFDLAPYISASIIVAATSVIARSFLQNLSAVNLVMIYELAVVITALKYGKGPSILSAVLSVAAFDFFFIPPYLSFAVTDTQYVITFFVMLVVGLLLSTLTSTVRQQARSARERERVTEALYAMTREQAVALEKSAVVQSSVKHIADVFDCKVAVLLQDQSGQLQVEPGTETSFEIDAKELGVAQWVFINQRVAGVGTSTLPGAKAVHFPLSGAHGAVGVIAILPSVPKRLQDPEEMRLLEVFINQMALAVERALQTTN